MSVKIVRKRCRKFPDKANFEPIKLVDESYLILDTYSTLIAYVFQNGVKFRGYSEAFLIGLHFS